jgi:anthranilate/para-aminobenzoate synthase component I
VLTARVLPVPPRPLELARRLAGRPGFALLYSAPGRPSYLASDPIAERRAIDPEPELELYASRRDLARIPRWIGFLPYEARRGIERRPGSPEPDPRPAAHVSEPLWLRYAAVAEIGETVRVVGDDPAAVDALSSRLGAGEPSRRSASLRLCEPDEPEERHAARIRRALEQIAAGEVYVVNIARRFRFAAEGHPLALLERFVRRAPAPYAAALSFGELDVVSLSPELFLRTSPDGRIETWPIKGTRPRGHDACSDREQRKALALDPKERAELAMVVDVERNDLGRIAATGTVRVNGAPEIQTHRTLHHRVARVSARLRADLCREAVLEAMLPSGSVTGAPKGRAMGVIAELEPHRRGLYTGAIGFLRADGSVELGMAIRTLTVRDGEAHYHAGGGIVADSDPAREVEETRWKALTVLAAAGA